MTYPQKIDVKAGIKLPKTIEEWNAANEYFKATINLSAEITDLNGEVDLFQESIYNYFRDVADRSDVSNTNAETLSLFQMKYNHLSRRQLKYHLNELKSLQCDTLTSEIQYVSKLLRLKYSKRTHALLSEKSHDIRIQENFWAYCREIFEDGDIVLPDFDEKTCYNFFSSWLKPTYPNQTFDIPIWMKKLDQPNYSFDITAPTYSEISKIIRKMKSGSCPFDQISILVLKNCPILRTALHRIMSHYWDRRLLPKSWKQAFTILIHKKDNAKLPSNFRPITLQPVFAKVFTSIIRNGIYSYLVQNEYIETNIQKGFWKGISGTIKHNELLTHIINHARKNQRHLVITLLDLKNAFGEVHHNLLQTILSYHHIPSEISGLIRNIYEDYTVSIGTKELVTSPMKVGKGVIQGDCLSPLLFNMCINSLISLSV